MRVAKTRDHRPALRNRVDAAFGVLRRSERRAVVEVGAAVPLAVPGRVERVLEPRDVGAIRAGLLAIAARLHERGKWHQNRRQKPPEPDALAASMLAYFVHAVVPVARANQRQPMRAGGYRSRDSADAVFVDRQRFVE